MNLPNFEGGFKQKINTSKRQYANNHRFTLCENFKKWRF